MSQNILIQKLERIESLIKQQGVLKKEVLNFNETCLYLALSHSYLYKLTSNREIPHSKPKGKKLFFQRAELDQWLLQNRIASKEEIEQQATNYLIKKGRVTL